MPLQLANAYPKKSFFIQMFTKDVSLEDCILDLIDNSIDGLMRTRRVHLSDISKSIFQRDGHLKTRRTGLPLISIEYSQSAVTIRDNCGGIDFGHSPKQKGGYLGVYGIGLKRALFKIGRKFHIESRTNITGFSCDLDVDQWLLKDENLDDWKIPLNSIDKANKSNSAGTIIEITRLHDEVKLRLKDKAFETQLSKAIELTYAFFLNEYVCVKLNGREIRPFAIPVGKPKHGNASYEWLERNGVKVRILATIARKDDRGQLALEPAGWYIVCNGRVVLAADKSEKSGWNVTPMPQFHSKYRAFIGFVFFESSDPLLLPWTTTKRGLNQESSIYLHVKDRMAIAARPIIQFCNKKYPSDIDEEPIEREIAKEVTKVAISDLITRKHKVFIAMPPKKVSAKTTTRVQYDAENVDLMRIKKHLRKPRMGANKIGKHTFNYFLIQEGLK